MFSELTIVQIDAHADLREELEGDAYSHACAIRRSLDLGVGMFCKLGFGHLLAKKLNSQPMILVYNRGLHVIFSIHVVVKLHGIIGLTPCQN